MPPTSDLRPPPSELSTDFASRWAVFAASRPAGTRASGSGPGLNGVGDDPARDHSALGARWEPYAIDELRNLAREFFSWGLVHAQHQQRRLADLAAGRGPPAV